MKVSRLRLLLAYLFTVLALALILSFNSHVFEMRDRRALDCIELAGVGFLAPLIVAWRRYGQGFSAAWYLRLCFAVVGFAGAFVAYGALIDPFTTPMIFLFSVMLAACAAGLLDPRRKETT